MSEELCRTSCLTSVFTKVTRALDVPFLLKCHFGNVCGLHLGGSPLFPLSPSLPLTICYLRSCLRDSRSFSYRFSNKSFQTHPGAQPKPGESVNNKGPSLGKAVQVRDSVEERSAELPSHGWINDGQRGPHASLSVLPGSAHQVRCTLGPWDKGSE